MALISISNCPICDGTEFQLHLSCIDHTASQEKFLLKKCLKCNFVFTDPRPDETTINYYYKSEKYISHTGGTQNLIDKIYLKARKLTLRWKKKLVTKYSSPNKILDIGCGTGEFLQTMQDHGWTISGVEPTDHPRESAEKKTGTALFKSLAEIHNEKFNVITLWHVLEHLPDPNEALKRIHNLLEISGTVFIAVPNLKSYDAHYYQSEWAAYDVPRHFWHFDQKSMTKLLEKNNLSLVKIIPMQLDAYYVSLLSATYKYPKRSKVFNLFTAMIVGIQSNLLAKKTFEYSSLIYVVKR